MTGRERALNHIAGQPVDRLPLMPITMMFAADQIGVPNWSRSLAEATERVVAQGLSTLAERAGLYHLSSTGRASWYEFARAIVGAASKPRVVPISTADYPLPARRPAFAVLDTSRFAAAFGFALPDWRDALARCLASGAEAASESPG